MTRLDLAQHHRVRLVDPASRVIEVYRLTGSGYVLEQTAGAETMLTSPTIEGLAFAPGDVFP